MLVDDEEMITDAIGSLLEKVGYRVICVNGGKEAVRVVEQFRDDINLVILDMLMPDMDGQKTFHRIKDIQPQLPVLMASGYNNREQLADIMQNGCKGFIRNRTPSPNGGPPFNAFCPKIRTHLKTVQPDKKVRL